MEKTRPTQQYLLIDVTKEEWSVRSTDEQMHETYLGGAGIALSLYEEYRGLYTSEIASPLVFSTGIYSQLNDLVPSVLTIAGLSPLNKKVRVTGSPSRFAPLLASTGFHSIVLVGSARRQMLLTIDDQDVRFLPSEQLIGKQVEEALSLLNPTKEEEILIIGPSAEKEIPLSAIFNSLRPLEREGFGAVLGMKRVKALKIARGGYTYCASSVPETRNFITSLETAVSDSYLSRAAGEEGAMYPVCVAMKKGAASVFHDSKRTDPRMKHLCRNEHPELFQSDEKGMSLKGGEPTAVPVSSLTMLAFGSNIGNYDPIIAAHYTRVATDWGLEPLSTARVISWCMEAQRRGVTDDFSLRYDDFTAVEQVIAGIAKKSDAHEVLTRGTAALGEHFKAKQFITSIENKETLPIDPRGAFGEALVMALGYDFLLPSELLSPERPGKDFKGKGKEVLQYELLYLLSTSLGIPYRDIFSLVYRKPVRFLRRKSGSLKLIAEAVSLYLGREFDEPALIRVARETLRIYEKVNGSLSASAKVPLHWLIETSSNVEDETTVPFTKLFEEYLHERELMLIQNEESN